MWQYVFPPTNRSLKRYAQNGTVFLFCIIEDIISCNNSGNISYVRPSSHYLLSSWLSTVNTFHMQCLATRHDMFIFQYDSNINLTYISYWCLWRNCEWISHDLGSRLKATTQITNKSTAQIDTVSSLPSMDQDLKGKKTLWLLKDNVSP